MSFKTVLFSALTTVALAGCNPEVQKANKTGVRSGAALEAVAASGTFVASSQSASVARSKKQVMAALESFSKQCLAMSVQYGRFKGDAAVQNDYVPVFTNEDGITRHVLFRKTGGHSVVHISEASRGHNVAASTKIIPTSANSTMLTITTTFGMKSYASAILKAVRGEGILCPSLS